MADTSHTPTLHILPELLKGKVVIGANLPDGDDHIAYAVNKDWADKIVRAVNSYDRLLEEKAEFLVACKTALAMSSDPNLDGSDIGTMQGVLIRAITKTEGRGES